MDIERAYQLLNEVDKQKSSTNKLIAHANARYILFNVNEPIENHPPFFKELTPKINNLSFLYLNIGCAFIENKQYEKGCEIIKKAANLIEFNHLPEQNRNDFSDYYILISALAFYASSEYSKAFIVLNKIEQQTEVGLLLNSFLKKDFNETIKTINSILLNENYLNEIKEETLANIRVCNSLFAKSIASLLEYFYSGDLEFLNKSKEIIQDIIELAKIIADPALWWIGRLFKIILNGVLNNSFWENIPLRLNPDNDENIWEFDESIYELFPFLKSSSNDALIKTYINSLINNKPPISELFISQKIALDKILTTNGAVISLPTSSGKTRIAEIAILQSLIQNRLGKVLYLAPFRTLAFEIENSLSETFVPLNYTVSHLYGGSQFSKLDKTLIEEAHILVATPEKAKAILRANKDISSSIKLIIIDEGHLIDTSKRYVTNELFVEELKLYVKGSSGKIILLSAVLPNTEEISEWITGNKDSIVKNSWRPSSQRLGLLEFSGKNVDIEWLNTFNEEAVPTFNKNFIKPFQVRIEQKKGFKIKDFPDNKHEAIAVTATKLVNIGSVLIFIGSSRNVESSVLNYAKSVQTVFNNQSILFDWNDIIEWKEFKLVCNEYYGENSELLKYAKSGIICHHGRFPAAIRISIDKLLRTKKAKIIISTTTLAQGVNIGVSSVIFANIYNAGEILSKNDFWNIAGRSGRAYIDTEGKILISIDKSIISKPDFKPTKKYLKYSDYYDDRTKKIKYNRKIAKEYLLDNNLKNINSGFLEILSTIKEIAKQCKIDFDTLLQLITENDFSKFKLGVDNYSEEIKDFFDWTDDVLLNFEINSKDENWIDNYFKHSLAYIQAKHSKNISGEEIIKIIKSRRLAILKIANTSEKRFLYVTSGLPLLSISQLDDNFDNILSYIKDFFNSNQKIDDLLLLLANIENIVNQLPSSSFKHDFSREQINLVRSMWIKGEAINKILEKDEKAIYLINNYFSYTIPWVLNAINSKLKYLELLEESTLIEELSVLYELGLPNFNAAKIYLAGVKSRIASNELSTIFKSEFLTSSNINDIARAIIKNKDKLVERSKNKETIEWINIIEYNRQDKTEYIQKIDNFYFKKEVDSEFRNEKMLIREFDNQFYFTNPDYTYKLDMESNDEFPFNKISNRNDIYFEFNNNAWVMKSRNPKIKIST